MVHLSVVPNDRRARARVQRRERYLEAAGRIIDREGLAAVTMQAVADELDCAIGTIYTYFPSKSALVAGLQARAVATLGASYSRARDSWDEYLQAGAVDTDLAHLVQLLAFGSFCTAASVVFADEFHLQRLLLSEPVGHDESDETKRALPVLEALLATPRGLLDAAAKSGVVDAGDSGERVLRWLAALNGVLLLDNLASLDRHLFRSAHLARSLTADLLVGWGASRVDVEVAGSQVERLAALGPMAPPTP